MIKFKKIISFIFAALLVLSMTAMLTACGPSETGKLVNGDFCIRNSDGEKIVENREGKDYYKLWSSDTDNRLPYGWQFFAKSATSQFGLGQTAKNANIDPVNYFEINHAEASYSFLSQKIDAKKNTYYKLSLQYQTMSLKSYSGSSVTGLLKFFFAEDYSVRYSSSVSPNTGFNTDQEKWAEYTVYVNTGSFDSVSIYIMLGGDCQDAIGLTTAGAPSTGSTPSSTYVSGAVRIKNITVTETEMPESQAYSYTFGLKSEELVKNNDLYMRDASGTIMRDDSNANILDADVDSSPLNFTLDSSLKSAAATVGKEVRENAIVDGSPVVYTSSSAYIKLNHDDYGYSTVTQRIKVKPDTCYQISYKYYIPADADRKISFRSNEFEKYGLYTAILQDPVYYLNSASASQYHTAIRSQIKNDPTRGILNYSGNEGPRWETSSQFYVMSGDNNNLDLGIALGTKENPVKGEVWFTALSVKQYDPAKLSLISRYPIANNNGFSNSKAGEIAMLCIGGLFATGASLAFIFLIVNSLAKNKDTVQPDITPDKAVMAEKQAGSNDSTVAPAKKLSKPLVITPAVLLGAVMFIGFILRIVLSFFVKGDAGIIGSAEAAFAKLKTAGLSGYISESSPLLHLMPLSAVFLRFASLFIGGIDSFGILLLLKLPNILSDLAIAFVIFKFAGSNKKLGSVLAAVYLINPFTILSTLSLKTDTVFILAIILTAYFMLNKKYLYLFISYTAAILLNLDALLIAPVIVTYLAIKFAQSVKYCIDNRANGTRNNLRSKDGSLALTIPTFTLASFAVFYLLSLPMTFNIYDANPIKIFEYFFVTPINSGSLMSAGGMNIFAMLSQSGKAVSAGYSGAWYAFVIFCLLSAITCAFYLVKKNRIVILLAMTLSVYTISVLFTGAGEAFGLPVVSLLLATFAVTKDRRILFSAMFYSLIGFANQYIGLMNSYGFSFLPDYLFNPLINPMYNGSSIITGGIYNYALVFLSTLNLIGFAFFCYTFIRIAFESKVSLRFSVFKPREGFVPFGAALKDFVSRSKR